MLRIQSRPTSLPPLPGPLDGCAGRIKTLLGLRACWFESFPFDRTLPRLEQDRVVLPAAEPGAQSYADWRPGLGIELPVEYRGLTLGRFVLVPDVPTCGIAIPPTARACAIDVVQCAGTLFGRQLATYEPCTPAERGT